MNDTLRKMFRLEESNHYSTSDLGEQEIREKSDSQIKVGSIDL